MIMLLVSATLMAGAQDGPLGGLLGNGGFDAGLDRWRINAAPGIRADAITEDGRSAARIVVSSEAAIGYPCLYQNVQLKPGAVLELQADALGRGIRDGYGAYVCLEFYDAAEKRLQFSQSEAAGPDGAWAHMVVRAVVPPNTASTRVCLLVNGHGEGRFDNVTLAQLGEVALGPLEGPVTIKVTDTVACESLRGFGFEDDGWFYNPENASHGVDEKDIALREERIRWLAPAWIRMFYWYKDWCPSGDWQTLTFDSPNMQSHYRTLDLYQKMGACVNVVGVEWGIERPYAEPAKVAKAVGALLEHLIRTKGYTCVQEWTLTNEPNGSFPQRGNTFDEYVQLHELVKDEIVRRGLSVRIVGSDDTNGGWPWFKDCVQSDKYFAVADLFASHRYLRDVDRELATFYFSAYLGLLAQKTPRKPLIIAEFGFHDSRASGPLINPVMEDYVYALWSTAFVIEGLNLGVAGFSIWCAQEMYYPGNGFMNYGLWNYKDRGWQVRPVYHAWANFTRLARPGQKVLRCESSAPRHVLATKVGSTLFWVNRSEQNADIEFVGFRPKEVHVMTEATLSGDRECGVGVRPRKNSFEAPARSFGYAK